MRIDDAAVYSRHVGRDLVQAQANRIVNQQERIHELEVYLARVMRIGQTV